VCITLHFPLSDPWLGGERGWNSERAVSGDCSLPGDDLALAMTLGAGDHQGSRAGQDCAFPAAGGRQLGGRRASAERAAWWSGASFSGPDARSAAICSDIE